MAQNLKTRGWKIGRWFGLLFILMFIFRLSYGYLAKQIDAQTTDYPYDFFASVGDLRKNYASEKIVTKSDMQSPVIITSNQKFEKTAAIKSKTSDFETDEQKVKKQVKDYEAVIQYEQNLGLKGNREIHLSIGVHPEKFDSFYIDIQKVGIIQAKEVTTIDKTNEYRELNARKVSIEKTLNSLKELQSKNGQIVDFISLNEKILEVEERLQELGVELGNFDSINEFCTVKLSLFEGKKKQEISFIHRVKVAFEWTVKYFSILVFTFMGIILSVFVLLLFLDKLKHLFPKNKE